MCVCVCASCPHLAVKQPTIFDSICNRLVLLICSSDITYPPPPTNNVVCKLVSFCIHTIYSIYIFDPHIRLAFFVIMRLFTTTYIHINVASKSTNKYEIIQENEPPYNE